MRMNAPYKSTTALVLPCLLWCFITSYGAAFHHHSQSGFLSPRRRVVISRRNIGQLPTTTTTTTTMTSTKAKTITRSASITSSSIGIDTNSTIDGNTGAVVATAPTNRFGEFFPSSKLLMASSSAKRRRQTEQEDEARDQLDTVFLMLSVAPSLLAFLLWEDISHSLAVFLDQYGAIGRAVDGGQFAVTLLRPTITGVVVPVISIALATLVSTTVNVLRARQVELRALINKEACELRLLRRAIRGMFGTRQHAHRRAAALALVCSYVEQLERECSVGAVEELEDLQLSGGIAVNELDRLSEMLHGVHGAAASRQGSVGVADSLILVLTGHRSERVAMLLSVFPVIHWGVLMALSGSICIMFLLNSNQTVLQYLNSVQLRLLFAILVGVFSGTGMLCLDLADPFRGSFSISEAATQLGDLRLALKRDIAVACAEAGEISSIHKILFLNERDGSDAASIDSLVPDSRYYAIGIEPPKRDPNGAMADRDDSSPRRYGLLSTIYFHLLTGPLGSNVRMFGDVLAWATSFVSSRVR